MDASYLCSCGKEYETVAQRIECVERNHERPNATGKANAGWFARIYGKGKSDGQRRQNSM
jgi:hypothetical protein